MLGLLNKNKLHIKMVEKMCLAVFMSVFVCLCFAFI